ncbi:MAG TPA: carbohydrate ABC transporter permease [Gammaproteobacteria bacterium]|nr:carbohydrate ABC transporter permease [Gammaproteobacteria bacterium]
MRPGRLLRGTLVYALLLALAVVHVAPVAFMVVGSLKPDARVLADMGGAAAFWPRQPSLANYADVLARVDFGRFLANSAVITGGVVGLGLLVNGLAGYALARLRWRGRDWVLAAVLALLILPLEAIVVPLFYEVSLLGWRDTYTVQIVPFVANAFFVYLFYVFFLGLPRELEEAARMDGAGTLGTFFRVVAPNAKPAFATVAVLGFLFQWGQYLWPLMVTSGERVRPLPVAIAAFRTLPPLQWGDILAFGVMMVAPVVAVFLVFQRWFVRGVAASGVKG